MKRSRFFPTVIPGVLTQRDICRRILYTAVKTMQELGPDQTERTYERNMVEELHLQDIPTINQYHIYSPVDHECKQPVFCGILDILVRRNVLVELKANRPHIHRKHIQQVMRYYNALQHRRKKSAVCDDDDDLLALVINFTQISDRSVVQVWSSKTRQSKTFLVDRVDQVDRVDKFDNIQKLDNVDGVDNTAKFMCKKDTTN